LISEGAKEAQRASKLGLSDDDEILTAKDTVSNMAISEGGKAIDKMKLCSK